MPHACRQILVPKRDTREEELKDLLMTVDEGQDEGDLVVGADGGDEDISRTLLSN